MKLLLHTLSLLIVLGIGYLLGAQQSVSKNTHLAELPLTGKNITRPVSAPDSLAIPETTCECDHTNSTPHKASPNNKPSLPALFSQLLKSSHYSAAMNIYNTAWRLSENNALVLRQLFLQHITELAMQTPKAYERISEASNYFLADFYDDIDVLMLLTHNYADQQLFHDSLTTLQLANSYAYNDEQKQQVSQQYTVVISLIEQRFSENQEWEKLIDLYLFAETKNLLSNQDILRLIELYLQIGNSHRAKSYADKLPPTREWQGKIADIFDTYQPQKVADDNALPSAISLEKIANQYITPILLSNTPVSLLIDTGASMTTITKTYYDTIKSLVNMRFQKDQTFLTANGETTGQIYRVNELKIGAYTIENIDIAVLDYPSSSHSSGLLGMDVLRHFKFEIDQQKNLLYLQKSTHKN
jgi:clan AA aspartic protease (TIGR02281 family)